MVPIKTSARTNTEFKPFFRWDVKRHNWSSKDVSRADILGSRSRKSKKPILIVRRQFGVTGICQTIPGFHWLLPNILVESTSESIKTYADIKSALLLEILRDVLGDVKSISLRGKHPSVCVCSCRGNYSDLMGYRFVWKYSLPSFLNLPNIFPVWKIRNPTKRGNSLRSWISSRIGFLQQGKSSDPCWIVARLPTICFGLSSSRTNRSSPTI